MLSLERFCSFALAIATAGAVITHTHDSSFVPDEILHVTRANISIGGIQRYSTLVNGSIPGPPLRFAENQVAWVRVYNDMTDDNLTMHWHGISQAAYPFSDGTPLASQWPIPPQHFFDYELSFPNETAGTYFYHSHIGFQANTAAGALIIKEPTNQTKPYPVDDERIILVQELFNTTDEDALNGVQATPMQWTGDNSGWMINGKTIANYSVVDNSTAKWSVIDVEPSKTYRFRFIGGNTLGHAILGFQNHSNMQVIEADAGYTKLHSTDILQIAAGQRFSTLIRSKNCDELAALRNTDYYMMIQTRERPIQTTGYAILRYNASSCPPITKTSSRQLPTNRFPSTPPMTLPDISYSFLEYALAPLHPNNFPTASEVTRTVYINTQQIINPGSSYQWFDNGFAWTEETDDPLLHTTPAAPYLVAMYKNESQYLPNYDAAVANGGLDPGTRTFPFQLGEVIELIIQQNGSAQHDGKGTGGGLDTHPWHAHGAHYWDIGSGPGAYDRAANEKRLNGTSPVKRDTTMLYRYQTMTETGKVAGWRAWRLRIDDPGVWMVHCHILQHMIQGMQTVHVHGNASDLMRLERPMVEGYLRYGGDVYGNGTHDPRVVHFSEVEGMRRKKR